MQRCCRQEKLSREDIASQKVAKNFPKSAQGFLGFGLVQTCRAMVVLTAAPAIAGGTPLCAGAPYQVMSRPRPTLWPARGCPARVPGGVSQSTLYQIAAAIRTVTDTKRLDGRKISDCQTPVEIRAWIISRQLFAPPRRLLLPVRDAKASYLS